MCKISTCHLWQGSKLFTELLNPYTKGFIHYSATGKQPARVWMVEAQVTHFTNSWGKKM